MRLWATFACCVLMACGVPALPEDGQRHDAGRDAAIAELGPVEDDVSNGDPTGPPYPIVLLHGMGGFGKLKGLPITYFHAVRDDLVARGHQVFATVAPPYDDSEVRAKALAPQIDDILRSTRKRKVNLIGHSQGGTDARVLASPAGLGYGDRIETITSISTPHRGSQVADVTLKLIKPAPRYSVEAITYAVLKLLERAVYEIDTDPNLKAQLVGLSEHHMVEVFNPKFVDDPRVRYFSYAGRTNLLDGRPDCNDALYPDDPTKLDEAWSILVPTAEFLEGGLKKANDGLVTVQSAKWGGFLQCIPADHASEIGQLDLKAPDGKTGFYHLDFFRLVVDRIRERGA